MKKQAFKRIFGAASIGFASLALAANPQAAIATQGTHHAKEVKATAGGQRKVQNKVVREVGGLPLVTIGGDYGLSPKVYGIRFGHGNKKGKTNFLRLAHNAKLKRR